MLKKRRVYHFGLQRVRSEAISQAGTLRFQNECPLATDFIGRELQAILRKQGFDEFNVHHHYLGYVRLLTARKAG